MRLLVYDMLVNVNGIYYVQVCEQARWARSTGNSAIENLCIIVLLLFVATVKASWGKFQTHLSPSVSYSSESMDVIEELSHLVMTRSIHTSSQTVPLGWHGPSTCLPIGMTQSIHMSSQVVPLGWDGPSTCLPKLSHWDDTVHPQVFPNCPIGMKRSIHMSSQVVPLGWNGPSTYLPKLSHWDDTVHPHVFPSCPIGMTQSTHKSSQVVPLGWDGPSTCLQSYTAACKCVQMSV